MARVERKGFPQMNPEKSGAKGGSAFGNKEILDEIFPTSGVSDDFDVIVSMSPQDGDHKGVSSGPVSPEGGDKDDRVAPAKGDDTPGGGW
jgi:hypothetical protein